MLQLRQVKKSYAEPDGGRLPILDIAAFDVKNGEQMVLVGKSGCGKTTLLHTIAGITRADTGQILIDGIDIATLSEAGVDKVRAAKIGYVFQTFNLLPGFTALENVLLGMTFGRGRKDPARALANRPSLLLADEPTANIDPRNQQKIVDLIRETCREEKVSLVMVTHSTEVSGQFDRIDRLEEINQVKVDAPADQGAGAAA